MGVDGFADVVGGGAVAKMEEDLVDCSRTNYCTYRLPDGNNIRTHICSRFVIVRHGDVISFSIVIGSWHSSGVLVTTDA